MTGDLFYGMTDIQMPVITAGEVGAVLVGTGLLLGSAYLFKQWVKLRDVRLAAKAEKTRKDMRLQQAMGSRQDRLREILTEIIDDGILDAEMAGKISEQEMKKLLKEMSEKLDLPELVPTKTRSKIVKQEIKARRAKGFYKTCSPIPGPKPGEATPSVVKTFVNKYWRGKTVTP